MIRFLRILAVIVLCTGILTSIVLGSTFGFKIMDQNGRIAGMSYNFLALGIGLVITVVIFSILFGLAQVLNNQRKLYPVKRTRERVTFEPTSPVYGR